jgi:hypothetical protein
VRPRRFLGPRRILQLSLLLAAAIALLLALTGALAPAFAAGLVLPWGALG